MKTSILLTACLFFYSINLFAQPGTLDSSFGFNGKVTKPQGNGKAVAIQTDEKIVVGGSSVAGFTLVRYKSNGAIDKSFGINGIAIADFGNAGIVNSIVIKASGKIIAAGGDGKNFAVAKFNSNGTLDSSFGINGKVTTNFFGKRDEAKFVTFEPDNKIIVIGTAFDQNGEQSRIALARYKPDGTLDSSFNHTGKLAKHVNDYRFEDGFTMILQPNGKIVAIGDSFNPDTEFDFTLVRYKSNGELDKTFGKDGYTFTDFAGGFDVPVAAATQSDGKIIAAGYTLPNLTGFFTMDLARYTANGKLDSTFGTNGKVITTFNSISDAAYSIAIQNDDKIVVTGSGSGGGIEVARFTKNGFPDSSFGDDGRVNIDSASSESVDAIALKNNGKIIVAGTSSGNFLVARLKNDDASSAAIADALPAMQKNNPALSNIKIYPNPANNFLYVTGINKESTLSVFNQEGKLMAQTLSKNETHNLNIQLLPAGIYYLQIISEDKQAHTIKFVKQ